MHLISLSDLYFGQPTAQNVCLFHMHLRTGGLSHAHRPCPSTGYRRYRCVWGLRCESNGRTRVKCSAAFTHIPEKGKHNQFFLQAASPLPRTLQQVNEKRFCCPTPTWSKNKTTGSIARLLNRSYSFTLGFCWQIRKTTSFLIGLVDNLGRNSIQFCDANDVQPVCNS